MHKMQTRIKPVAKGKTFQEAETERARAVGRQSWWTSEC